MTAHVVTPAIYYGPNTGDFWSPISSTVKLAGINARRSRLTGKIVHRVEQGYGLAPSDSPNMITYVNVDLSVSKEYMGQMQDLEADIWNNIGSTTYHLWYADDILDVITTSNAEVESDSALDPETVEYTYTGDEFFAAGDYLYYPSGDSEVNDEIVVVSTLFESANYFTAYLEWAHVTGQELFKVNWVYPNARLDEVIPPSSSTGRGRMTLRFTSAGMPRRGTTLP